MPKTKAHLRREESAEPEYIFSEDNSLSPIGEKIFLDRYALKDGAKQSIKVGNTVVVNTDLKTGRREIGVVKGIVDKNITVELRDGTMIERLLEHVDVPLETKPTEMMSRIAKGIASVEPTESKQIEWENKFRWLLDGYKFVPGGRILTTAGTEQNLTAYNCYVIPSPQDSRGGILQTLGQMNEIFSRGGGVGINLSSLRPRYSYVKGVNGRSSGSVSWGSLYSYSTGLIEQGGCLTPDTLVNTKDGLLRLDEIVTHPEKGWQSQAQTIMTDEGERPSRQVYNNGSAETLSVTTDAGIGLTGTRNHKVKVMTDAGPAWRQLSDLKEGDAILVKLGQHQGSLQTLKHPAYSHHNQDRVKLPAVLDEDLAFFLGYFAGDGFSTMKAGDWRIGLSIAHSSYLMEEMPHIIERLFPGANARFQQKDDDASAVLVISNCAVKEFMRINGLDKEKILFVKIPRLIRQSPPRIVGAYLRGLFEADGGVSHRYPSLTSISERLVRETATLLIGLGCPIRIDETESDNSLGDNPKWRVRITSHRGLLAWQKFIGCDEQSRFAPCLNFAPDLAPAFWTEPVLSGITQSQIDKRAAGVRFKATDQPLRRSLLRYQRGDRNLTISAYDSLTQHHPEFARLAPEVNDAWFAFVKSVTPAGIQPTYDLEVDDNHTYLAGGLVTHNSRRGALMLILNDWHPDVLEFIGSKREAGKISNANISVGISDKFMAAVKADASWDLVFPDTSDPEYDQTWDGNLDAWLNKGKKVNTYKTLKAREIWDALIESAWASAEPGIFFNERSNKLSNSWYYAPLVCTNPCVTGDTLIYTGEGLRRADELAREGRAVPMVTDGRFGAQSVTSLASPMFSTGKKAVFRLQTTDGYFIRATKNHRFMTDRGWVKMQDLAIDDKLHILNRKGAFGKMGNLRDGRLLGWLVGDGVLKQNKQTAVLSFFGAEKRELAPIFAGYVNELNQLQPATNQRIYSVAPSLISGRDEARVRSRRLYQLSESESMIGNKHRVPTNVFQGTEDMQRGFLQALFTADGSVQHGVGSRMSVRLAANSVQLLEDTQRVLLNFGIACKIFKNRRKEHYRQLPDGHGGLKSYLCAAQHELIITKQNMEVFAKDIGFIMHYKQEKLEQLLGNVSQLRHKEYFSARIDSITPDGDEEVYDVSVPEVLTFTGNGLLCHNCGEQPLAAWSVCNLGAVNLARFVDEEAHDVAWEKLRQAIQYAIRFLDNVIDWTPYFFEENERQQKGERRVGMNTMGLAEMLVKLGIRYGSEESTAFIDRLYRFIAGAAYSTSADLAEEKGAFPWFESDKFLQSGYMKEMPKEIRQIVKEKGVRNVTLLTQAPNGTIGTMVGTSTGIEPFYSWTYFRTSRLGTHEEKVEIVQNWLKDHPDEELPDYFVTAMELSPEEHVAVQAAIQRWVDSAISKTCNAPESYTVEQTRHLYELMYDSGVKGGTIYRDKSRDTQILNTEKQDENKAVNNDAGQTVSAISVGETTSVKSIQSAQEEFRIKPRVRPAVISGSTEEIKTGMGSMFVTINEDPHGPFEVFATIGKSGSETMSLTEALGRLISVSLRSGIEIKTIIHHLSGIRGSAPVWQNGELILSVPDAIAKALERFIDRKNSLGLAEPTAQNVGQPTLELTIPEEAPIYATAPSHTGGSTEAAAEVLMCPECGGTMARESGCATCATCGYSRCG